MGALYEDGFQSQSELYTPHLFSDRRVDKTLHDNIHGDISVDPLSLKFIDTEQFQRLRDIKQLGLCPYVYPTAEHTRFQHSLGVYFLAGKALEQICRYQPELEIERADVSTVKLAGLLHDLGHGPYSHVFEHEFLPRVLVGHPKWTHEEMSERMVDYIVDEHHIDIDPWCQKRVKEMIVASSHRRHTPSSNQKRFLFDIVANGRNNIDVDKFDYIARDSDACGCEAGFDFKRLMENMKVIDDEICYRAKACTDVYKLFQTRADLFRNVYTHAKVKALEFMLVDAFQLADGYLQISKQVFDPEYFWKLDDTILKVIETSEHKELEQARNIVIRMRRRQLYQYCNEYTVPKERLEHFKDVRPEDIACSQTKGGVNLSPEDIVVSNVKIDLTCGKEDPVNSVHFFQNFDSDEKFKIPRERVSHLLPHYFEDRIVRVYAKEPNLVEAVSDAFENFQRKIYGSTTQVHGTPDGKKRRSPQKR